MTLPAIRGYSRPAGMERPFARGAGVGVLRAFPGAESTLEEAP